MRAYEGAPAVEALYEKLTDEEDARVCAEVSGNACREVPGNCLRLLGASTPTRIGDAITSPETVLAWKPPET